MKGTRSDSILLRECQDNVEIVTMNNPAKLNALSNLMLLELQTCFDEISLKKEIKTVIIRGNGKAFCAGHDLKEMMTSKSDADGGKVAMVDLFNRCSKMMQTIQMMPQPVIAQVDGLATAAGCQLVATCDMAVASEEALFGVNGVNIGLFCSTPMVALTRNIPKKHAFEMLTTGEFISALRAKELGLINRISKEDKLSDETFKLAKTVSQKLSAAVKIGKKAFYKQMEMPLAEAYQYTGEVMAENMGLLDTQEGINAFLEKRPPEWFNK